MIGLTKNLVGAGTLLVRRPQVVARFAGSACSPTKTSNPKFAKFQKRQQLFQKDDGKPIFLKGGAQDQMLYRATWGLCFLGLALNVKLFVHYLIM